MRFACRHPAGDTGSPLFRSRRASAPFTGRAHARDRAVAAQAAARRRQSPRSLGTCRRRAAPLLPAAPRAKGSGPCGRPGRGADRAIRDATGREAEIEWGRMSPDIRPLCFPGPCMASPVPISGRAPLDAASPGAGKWFAGTVPTFHGRGGGRLRRGPARANNPGPGDPRAGGT